MVQQSEWAQEPVCLFEWYNSQAALGDLSNCLVCHWVAALHDHFINSYVKALSGMAVWRALSYIIFGTPLPSCVDRRWRCRKR